MKPFTINITWSANGEQRHFDTYDTCRDLFISRLGACAFRHYPLPTNICLELLSEHDLSQPLEEIKNLAQINGAVGEELRTGAFGVIRRPFSLFGNDTTVVFAMYWLILADRLFHYYNGDMLKMIRSSEPYEWDYKVDQKRSIKLWKEFQSGLVVDTQRLLSARTGPINIRRTEWNTK